MKLFPLENFVPKKKFFLKLLKILKINESRLNSSVRSFKIWYCRFQVSGIKRVIFSRSPAAKLHQYRLNCRHIYVDLMAIETMKSFICLDNIDYLYINMVWLVKVGYLPQREGTSFFLMNLHRSLAGRYEHRRSIG